MTENHTPEQDWLEEALNNPDQQITELPFPTLKHDCFYGVVEEYVIPEVHRADVLKLLYPFFPVPKLNKLMVDIHEDRAFYVRDYKVVKDSLGLWLVSPYYFSSGGTVIDWMPAAGQKGHQPPLKD